MTRTATTTRTTTRTATTTRPEQDLLPRWARQRRLAVTTLACAAALIPWTLALAATLPSRYVAANWNMTWVGFDLGLTIALAAAGLAIWKRHAWGRPLSVLAATLLVCDAWFDVTTAASTTDLAHSAITAALVELPLAAMLLLASRRAVPVGLAPAPAQRSRAHR